MSPHAYLNQPQSPKMPAQFCGKAIFETRQQARRIPGQMGKSAARPAQKGNGGGLRAHFCQSCNGYHIGNKPRKRKASK